MSDYGLGTAKGIIEFEYNGERVVARVVEDFERIRGSGMSADEALRKSGNAAGIAGLAIAAGLGLAINSAADFEFSMSAISAVSGATADEMQQISDKALQIGADTAFSAGEAAGAIEELVKAGLSVPDVMNGAADATVALAAAGQIELPEAASIAAAALNQFKLSAEELPGVADLLAGAANASATGVSEIGSALSFVGPVAQAAGLSIEDTASSIALLANNGIDGMKAGTSLRAILTQLQPTTEGAAQAMRELGLLTEDGTNAFYNADGTLKDMDEIIGLLNGSMAGLTEQQRIAYSEAMFGRESLAAVSAMASTTSTEFQALSESIGEISAADVAGERLNNMNGSMEELRGSVETLAIGLGDKLLPMVNSVVEAVTSAVNWFSGLSDTQQTVIVSTAGVVGGLLLAFAAVTKIMQAVQTATAVWKVFTASQIAASIATKAKAVADGVATAAQWALNAAMTANPIGLIIAAIAALAAALVWFFTQTETGRQIWATVWEAIQTAVQAVVAWFQETIVPFFQMLWTDITTGWDQIVNVWNTIYNAVVTAAEWIWNAIQTYAAFWQGVIQGFISWITGAWDSFWNGPFGAVIRAAWDAVLAIITFVITLIQVIIHQVTQAIQWVWENVWGRIRDFVVDIWNTVYDWIAQRVEAARAILEFVLGAIKAKWEQVWGAVSSFVSNIWNNIYNWISERINAARDIISSVVETIKSIVQTAFNIVKDKVTSTWNAIYNAIKDPITDAYNWVMDKVEAIKDIFNNARDFLVDAGRDIMEGLLDGLRGMWDNVAGFFGDLTDSIAGWKGPEARDKILLKPNAKWIMDGFIDNLARQMPGVQRLLEDLTASMPTMLGAPEIAVASSASRTAATTSAAALRDVANRAGAPDSGVTIAVEWHAAPNDEVETRQQVLSMLGRASNVVQIEKIGAGR